MAFIAFDTGVGKKVHSEILYPLISQGTTIPYLVATVRATDPRDTASPASCLVQTNEARTKKLRTRVVTLPGGEGGGVRDISSV